MGMTIDKPCRYFEDGECNGYYEVDCKYQDVDYNYRDFVNGHKEINIVRCAEVVEEKKEMTIEEIRYRLQAMATMCTFQDAVGHDLSHKEIGLYNQAKDEAVKILKKYQKIEQIISSYKGTSISCIQKIQEVVIDGNED